MGLLELKCRTASSLSKYAGGEGGATYIQTQTGRYDGDGFGFGFGFGFSFSSGR